ncbi:MAG: hypothetical protein ABR526_09035 [Chthoniobacterales bacterium]
MKTLAILLSGLALTSCTTTSTTTADNRPSHRELSEKRVHTQEELQKTGHNESIADALSTVDASITTNHGR